MMRQTWKPVVALAFLVPFLAEVLSGATTVIQFFSPGIVLPYVVFLYGGQVLVVRELMVRKRFGLLSLACLGMIYGIYNEGMRSETLFHPLDSPIAEFASYGVLANVRVPWTVWILLWHSVFSVLMPILLVHQVFPALASKPWLPGKAAWTIGLLSAGSGVGYFLFLGESQGAQSKPTLFIHLGLMLLAGALLWLAARKLGRFAQLVPADGPMRAWRPLGLGATGYVATFLLAEVLCLSRTSYEVFLIYILSLAVVAMWLVARQRVVRRAHAVLLLLGGGLAQAVLGVLFGMMTGNILWSIGAGLFAVCFGFAARKLAS